MFTEKDKMKLKEFLKMSPKERKIILKFKSNIKKNLNK